MWIKGYNTIPALFRTIEQSRGTQWAHIGIRSTVAGKATGDILFLFWSIMWIKGSVS